MTDGNTDVRIVVLQRGWVVVGRYSETQDEVRLDGASVIRRWGTTKGLGELVDGPLKSTVLDRAGSVRAPTLGVVMSIACDGAAWAKHVD